MSKAVLGIFYKSLPKALKRVEELKRMWEGKVAFVVVGNKNKWIVISETQARECGLNVPYKARGYSKTLI